MPWSLTVQLSKVADVFDRDIKASEVQPRIQKHAAIPGLLNEPVSTGTTRIIRVIMQGVSEQNRAYLRIPQRQAKVTGTSRLDCVHCQSARFRRGPRKEFSIQCHTNLSLITTVSDAAHLKNVRFPKEFSGL